MFNVFGAVLFIVISMLFPFAELVQRIAPGSVMAQISIVPVSYTHLDVYKRQLLYHPGVPVRFPEAGWS